MDGKDDGFAAIFASGQRNGKYYLLFLATVRPVSRGAFPAPLLYSAAHVPNGYDGTDANDEHRARALSLIVHPKSEMIEDRAPRPCLFFFREAL